MNQSCSLEEVFSEYLLWHQARIKFFAHFVEALLKVKTVNLTQVATAICGQACVDSKYKRVRRFLRQMIIDQGFIALMAVKILSVGEENGVLTLDRTNWKFGRFHINILVLGLAYKGMAIPLFWRLLQTNGNSNAYERQEVVDHFLQVFPPKRVAYLAADREFLGVEWLSYLKREGIPFRIRVTKDTRITNRRGTPTRADRLFGNLKPGCYSYLNSRKVWGELVSVAATRMENGDYLVIITDGKPQKAFIEYARRWEIETLFGALKTRGFRFEDTHLTDLERIGKLLAVLTIAFYWAYRVGTWLEEQKEIPLKKHGRKAKSIFRYGFDYLRSILLDKQAREKEFLRLIIFLSRT